jgi:hypothetical protein
MTSRPRILARLLSLLGAVMLMAAPLTPAVAMPMDCCPDAPCKDLDKSLCAQACAVACLVVPTPTESLAEPVRQDTPAPEATPVPRLIGRDIAPEPPPPR